MSNTSKPPVLTVGQLNSQIRDTLQTAFRNVWVAGEITDLSRPGSGHLYFSLKDPSGNVNAVMWRSTVERTNFEPEDGMQVLCNGDVDVYAPRGTYQLIVRRMQIQGEGSLQVALRQLREKLESQGLFDPNRKRRLPRFSKHIAVVTSPSGAALRDFLEVVRRRWSEIQLTIVPTRVQGSDCAPEVATAIRDAGKLPVDAVLVTRGGGSLEDLWAFNSEQVVRAIHASQVPVVSAVGHEIDVTLADLVADVRALTPTEAGELLVPDAVEMSRRLQAGAQRMNALLRARLDRAKAEMVGLSNSRVFREPLSTIRDRERMLDETSERVKRAVRVQTERTRSQLASYAAQLDSLSPLKVLGRGYAIAQAMNGAVIRQLGDIAVDESIRIRLSDGTLSAIVSDTERDASKGRSSNGD